MLLRSLRRFLNNRFFIWRENKKDVIVGIVITKTHLVLPRVLKKKVKSNKIYYFSIIEKSLEYSFEYFNKWDEKLIELDDINSAIVKVNLVKPIIRKKSKYIYLNDVWKIEKFYPCNLSKFYYK